jgi:alkylated DNA repair dioxygenase AlkB
MHAVRHAQQAKLFDVEKRLPNGLVYRPDFLTPEEEELILINIENLQLRTAYYQPDELKTEKYKSKRRHLGFGWGYDSEREEFVKGEPLPRFLEPVKKRIAKWLGISHRRVVEALINEYTPGSAIGWHRDRERFEHIVGISLAGWARMKFRPLPKPEGSGNILLRLSACNYAPENISQPLSLELEPRSAYIMQQDVRWRWQHSVAPVEALRYSITFRTLPLTERTG